MRTDNELINAVEADGDEISNYPVDESQTISNAGNGVQYIYNGKKYEIITWNECADEHEPESKEITELNIEEWSISHSNSGEEVMGGFESNEEAYIWLNNKINELEPSDIHEYIVEKCEKHLLSCDDDGFCNYCGNQ